MNKIERSFYIIFNYIILALVYVGVKYWFGTEYSGIELLIIGCIAEVIHIFINLSTGDY